MKFPQSTDSALDIRIAGNIYRPSSIPPINTLHPTAHVFYDEVVYRFSHHHGCEIRLSKPISLLSFEAKRPEEIQILVLYFCW